MSRRCNCGCGQGQGYPERSHAKVREMNRPGKRGPHWVCYRCDSFDMDESGTRCKSCDCYDMVAKCRTSVCGACQEARTKTARTA